MINRSQVGVGAGLTLLVAGGLFLAAGGLDLIPHGPAPTPVLTNVVRGNSGKYLYSITNSMSQPLKSAQFDPSLPPDDTVVVDTLKAVAKDEFGLVIGDDIQPAVETIDENNYVTFTVGHDKVLFELFRNSSGGVGAAHFYKQRLP